MNGRRHNATTASTNARTKKAVDSIVRRPKITWSIKSRGLRGLNAIGCKPSVIAFREVRKS